MFRKWDTTEMPIPILTQTNYNSFLLFGCQSCRHVCTTFLNFQQQYYRTSNEIFMQYSNKTGLTTCLVGWADGWKLTVTTQSISWMDRFYAETGWFSYFNELMQLLQVTFQIKLNCLNILRPSFFTRMLFDLSEREIALIKQHSRKKRWQ